VIYLQAIKELEFCEWLENHSIRALLACWVGHYFERGHNTYSLGFRLESSNLLSAAKQTLKKKKIVSFLL